MSACHPPLFSLYTHMPTLRHGPRRSPATQYLLVSKVEARPDLISMVTGCLACVEESLQLEDVEEGMVNSRHLFQAPSSTDGGP